MMLKRQNVGDPPLIGNDRFEGYCFDLLKLLAQNISGFEWDFASFLLGRLFFNYEKITRDVARKKLNSIVDTISSSRKGIDTDPDKRMAHGMEWLDIF